MNVPFRDGQGGVASTLALQSHQKRVVRGWLDRSGDGYTTVHLTQKLKM
jgi:hypothetical protein